VTVLNLSSVSIKFSVNSLNNNCPCSVLTLLKALYKPIAAYYDNFNPFAVFVKSDSFKVIPRDAA